METTESKASAIAKKLGHRAPTADRETHTSAIPCTGLHNQNMDVQNSAHMCIYCGPPPSVWDEEDDSHALSEDAMMEQAERRQFPRVTLPMGIWIDSSGERSKGALINLTAPGIAFHSPKSIMVGSDVTVSLIGNARLRSCQLKGEVVRCAALSQGTDSFYVALNVHTYEDEYLMDALHLIHSGAENHP